MAAVFRGYGGAAADSLGLEASARDDRVLGWVWMGRTRAEASGGGATASNPELRVTRSGVLMKSSAVVAHVAAHLLGVSAGFRSFTPLAVTAWFAYTGRLDVEGTWASWVASPAAVGLATAAAVGEYVGDKLPNTPNRTAAVPLIGRVALGGLVGAIVATALRRPVAGGIALGAAGAAAGTYGSFYVRRGLTKGAGLEDLPVALSGDVAAVTIAVRSLLRLTGSTR